MREGRTKQGSGAPPTYYLYINAAIDPVTIAYDPNQKGQLKLPYAGDGSGESLHAHVDANGKLEIYFIYYQDAVDRLLILADVSSVFFHTNRFRLRLSPGCMDIEPIR